MVHRDLFVDSLLEAQFESPEEASKEEHPDFSPAVTHRVVRDGVLLSDLIHVLQLGIGQLNRAAC